jgi:simple sugar transport system ATP-binding protein
VHDALRAARANGVAVVLYSSDLDEVLALADRVVVMLGGRLQALDTTDRDVVGRAMLGSQ